MSGGGVLGAVSARIFVCLAVVGVCTPTAHAETLLVVEPSGSSAASAGAGRLVARFEERVAAMGWTTRRASAAEQERAVALLGCDTASCSLAGLAALNVDAVLAPSVWQRTDGRRELAMSLQGPSGHLLELVSPVDAARPMDAADTLAGRFLAAWPALRTVPDEAELDDGDAPVLPSPPRERSPWNVPVGAGLLIVGVVPTALGAAALVRDGDCVVVDGQRACTVSSSGTVERYHAGVRSYSLLGAGVVTAGLGLYVLAAGPIRVRPTLDITSNSVTAGVAGSF